MSANTPIDVIDPEAQRRRWLDQFTYHLDLVPPVIDAVIMSTLPSIRASQTDKIVVTGGGYIDNMTTVLAAFDQSGAAAGIQPSAAVQDARELWGWLVAYTRAAADWIHQPAPTLADKPDADPLTARGIALTTVGWLIDHADPIRDVHELDQHRDEMFALIRRLRSRYGVTARPREPRRLCPTCGERAVVVAWVDGPNGSPKPVRVARCRTCGETFSEAPVAQEEGTAA